MTWNHKSLRSAEKYLRAALTGADVSTFEAVNTALDLFDEVETRYGNGKSTVAHSLQGSKLWLRRWGKVVGELPHELRKARWQRRRRRARRSSLRNG